MLRDLAKVELPYRDTVSGPSCDDAPMLALVSFRISTADLAPLREPGRLDEEF